MLRLCAPVVAPPHCDVGALLQEASLLDDATVRPTTRHRPTSHSSKLRHSHDFLDLRSVSARHAGRANLRRDQRNQPLLSPRLWSWVPVSERVSGKRPCYTKPWVRPRVRHVMPPALKKPAMAEGPHMLPESCRTIARHGSRKAALGEPSELRSCPNVVKDYAGNATLVRFRPRSHVWPSVANIGPNAAEVDKR